MEDSRTRIYETIWLFWAFLVVGFVNGIIGPTLLDLQQMVGASMAEMTYVFFAQGIGFIAGILVTCTLERCVCPRLLLTLSVLLCCVANFLFPWSTLLYQQLVVMFCVLGVAKGLVDYGVMSICNQLWDKKGVPFQFVTLGAGIAAFVSPFLATPFLAIPYCSGEMVVRDFRNQTGQASCEPGCHLSTCSLSQTRVQYAYVIIGIICFPAAPAIAHYYRKRKAEPLLQYEQFEPMNKPIYSVREMVFVTLIFLFYIPVFAIVLVYCDLLTPYGVNILHLSKSRMAAMTSVFWGSLLVGRAINLLVTKCLTSFNLLAINLIGLAVTSTILTFAPMQEVVLWVGSVGLGVFVSPFFPMVLAWSAEHVFLRREVITASLVAGGIGELVLPFITGRYFTVYGPQCLMYFVLGIVLYEVVIFALLAVCSMGMKVNSQDLFTKSEK